jgi:exportin-2 (importin alpha re-exporter)
MTNVKSKNEFIKNNLMKIFDILILPNISITQEDEDEYEDDPDAYIKNDLEESDVETRRRYCMKFVQQLSKKYPQEVGSLIGNYVNSFIAEYQSNREANWTRMTSLLNLLVTASISSYTYKNGATEINISPTDLWNYVS